MTKLNDIQGSPLSRERQKKHMREKDIRGEKSAGALSLKLHRPFLYQRGN